MTTRLEKKLVCEMQSDGNILIFIPGDNRNIEVASRKGGRNFDALKEINIFLKNRSLFKQNATGMHVARDLGLLS